MIRSSILFTKELDYCPIKQYDGTLSAELKLVFTKQSPCGFSDAYVSHQLAVKGESVMEVICDSSQILKRDHLLLTCV